MAEMMLKLRPWMPPNYATPEMPPPQGGMEKGSFAAISVRDLPQDALDGMAGDWLDQLYKDAGKTNPWTRARK